MQDTVAARKYAKAFFAEADKQNQIPNCQLGLDEFLRVWRLRPSLRDILTAPLIPSEDKTRLIHSVLGEGATALVERFISLLITKHRLDLLPQIVQEFRNEVDRHQGVQPLRVRVAFPLPEAKQNALKVHLEKWLSTKVRMDVEVDSSLIGGLVVQTPDRVLDHSLKGQLKRLKEQLVS